MNNHPPDQFDDEEEGHRVSVLQRIGSFFSLRDEDEDEALDHEADAPPKRNVVAFSSRSEAQTRRGTAEVSVFAPRAYTDVTEIADALRSRQVVIVNLQAADRALLQRVVDFVSGVAYTLDGRIQKLAEAMYLVVPLGVPVNAQGIRETLGSDTMIDFSPK
jgi:cell division inhibitor SepF